MSLHVAIGAYSELVELLVLFLVITPSFVFEGRSICMRPAI